MSIQLKLRRGTTAQHSTFTGAEGEVTVDTTKDTLVVHDGVTPGGVPLLKENNPSYTGTLTGGTGVVNLGSGQFYKDASGNVGIGTASPAAKLDVAGSMAGASVTFSNFGSATTAVVGLGDGNTGLFRPAAQTLGFTANGAERMRIDSSGNVGIGTNSPAFDIGSGIDVERTGDTAVVRAYRADASVLGGISLIGANSSNGIYSAGAKPVIIYTNETEQARIDSVGGFYFNSGYGSAAKAFGCRAWVNFNGTGTPAIRASGNVSSITDNGVGDWTLNFASAMPDVNYSPVLGYGQSAAAAGYKCCVKLNTSETGAPALMSTTQLRIITGGVNSSLDLANIYASVFR